MKKRILVLMLITALFIISLLQNNYDTYAHSSGAPSFECEDCHSGGEGGSIDIMLDGLPENYVLGKTYNLKLKVNSDVTSEGEYQGGFALTTSGGKIIVEDRKNTQISENYLTHTSEGSKFREWKFKWVAPLKPNEIEFTIMAVAANGDYSPNGDVVGVEVLKIKAKEKK